ncbi:heterokaryon incompatibility protein [Colletotrichum chrysophilum]|uniref:Heterokaryon incompatibility protein n=1 Tax=Colletotrichum chrysophilum TaxID=1836956 RepID=A0AAD9ELV3_9PEZI|nr:heterokaryon incompatibility protein [Colletotrichum chrysophilum]
MLRPLFVECGERFVAAFTHTNALIHTRGLKGDRSFLRTLHDLRWQRCSKPRDRVYGMLGMDFTFPTSNMQPDDDIPIEQLFIDVALQNIQHTKTLDIFSFFSPGKKTSLNLPSFIPDWSLKPTNHFTHLLCGDRQMTLLHYNASWGSQAKFRFQFDDLQSHATVNGVLINRIRTVGNACFFSDPGDLAGATSIVKQARQLARLPDRLPASYGAASQRELQFWRTMCGNLAVNYLKEDREWKLADPAADFDSYLRWYKVVSSKENYCPSLLKNEPFQYPLVPNLSGRRFIRTNSGDMGMADAEAQPNDIVMVLAGGKVPYVLREQDAGTTSSKHKRYRLIGDAYLDGIMQGEGVAGNAKWTEVILV